jgi:hypothetical protein
VLHMQCSYRIHPSVSCTGPHNACNAHWKVSSWPVLGTSGALAVHPVTSCFGCMFWTLPNTGSQSETKHLSMQTAIWRDVASTSWPLSSSPFVALH